MYECGMRHLEVMSVLCDVPQVTGALWWQRQIQGIGK
jgi:hypothetical protein